MGRLEEVPATQPLLALPHLQMCRNTREWGLTLIYAPAWPHELGYELAHGKAIIESGTEPQEFQL